MWRSLPEAFSRKTDKVGVSRWFATHKGLKSFLPLWHRRALVTVYQVVQSGVDRGRAPAELLRYVARAAAGADEDVTKERTGQPAADAQKLRQQTRNTLELVGTVLLDDELLATARIMVMCLDPIQKFHSLQRVQCRSHGCVGGLFLVRREYPGARRGG